MKKVKINADKSFILKIKGSDLDITTYKVKLSHIISSEKMYAIVFSAIGITPPVPPPPPSPRHVDSTTPK